MHRAAHSDVARRSSYRQRLSIREPVAVARAKVLAAGAFNVALAVVIGERFPSTALHDHPHLPDVHHRHGH